VKPRKPWESIYVPEDRGIRCQGGPLIDEQTFTPGRHPLCLWFGSLPLVMPTSAVLGDLSRRRIKLVNHVRLLRRRLPPNDEFGIVLCLNFRHERDLVHVSLLYSDKIVSVEEVLSLI
jgi:hypothetical protein